MILRLFLVLILFASPASARYGMQIVYGAGVAQSAATCSAPHHTATWSSGTYATEWDSGADTGASNGGLTISSGRLLLTQVDSDGTEWVYITDSSKIGTGVTAFTAYFEWEISAVSGLNANDYQSIFSSRSNAIKDANFGWVTDSSGNIAKLRADTYEDIGVVETTVSISSGTVYDFLVTVKYDSGAGDGYMNIKYRAHGSSTWSDGPSISGSTHGVGSTLDRIGVGMTTTAWTSGTIYSYWDNWSLRNEICNSSNY